MLLVIEMLSKSLLLFLRRTFSYADRFYWLSFTFDKEKKIVTTRKRRSAWLHRLSLGAYLIYVFLQTYGILWHNRTSNRSVKLISALFNLIYVGALVVTLYWEPDPGIPQLLNVLIKPRMVREGEKGTV